MKVERRNKIVRALNNRMIDARVYYETPVHRTALYRSLGYSDYLPATEQASQSVFSLPIHPAVSREEILYVGEQVKEVISRN